MNCCSPLVSDEGTRYDTSCQDRDDPARSESEVVEGEQAASGVAHPVFRWRCTQYRSWATAIGRPDGLRMGSENVHHANEGHC
jgi:hypothetical protein